MTDKPTIEYSPENSQYPISVSRITVLKDPQKATVAFASVRVGPMLLHGFSIVRSNNENGGLWVAPPSRYDEGQKRRYKLIELDDNLKKRVQNVVLSEYEEFKKKAHKNRS